MMKKVKMEIDQARIHPHIIGRKTKRECFILYAYLVDDERTLVHR